MVEAHVYLAVVLERYEAFITRPCIRPVLQGFPLCYFCHLCRFSICRAGEWWSFEYDLSDLISSKDRCSPQALIQELLDSCVPVH